MTLTHEERIERFVARKRASLEGRDYTYSKLRVVLDECGWMRRGGINTQLIQAACQGSGIFPEPMLTTPGIDWEEPIYFSRVEPKPYYPELYSPHPAFSSERDLQLFLARNYRRILKLKHLKKPILEHDLPSGRKIDILCRERGTNAYVVIELKKFARDPVDQIKGYLKELHEEIIQHQAELHEVKGIIITDQPSAVLERSLQDRIPDYAVTWFLYRVELSLIERASALPRG